jgi:cytochrome c oxidase subunit IV
MSLTHSNDIPAPVADDVGPDDPHGVHAVPRRILLAVYGALLVFTVITVGASKIDLGQANIWVALLIAVIKGALVTMYFMHLRWDSPFNGVILIAALFFVSLFIGLALLDSKTYQPQLKPTPMATQAP